MEKGYLMNLQSLKLQNTLNNKMITYNDLYEATRKERYSQQLQKLPANFVKSVADYLREKKEIANKEEDIFSDTLIKTKKQLENAKTLFKELILRRRTKILNLVLVAAEVGISKQDFSSMFNFEKELFEELIKNIEKSDKKINETLNGNSKESEQKNNLAVFLDNTEEFVDFEGNKLGPFEKGQIVNLQKEIIKILVEEGKAEIIEK